MIIAVNTRLLLKNRLEGIGWFTFETLKRITKDHPEHEFVFIFDRPYDEAFIFSSNVKPVILSPPTRHPFLWYLWFEFRIPALLKKIGADIFISTDGYTSLRSKIPSLDVIHDINFAHRPKDLPFLFRWYYNTFFPKYAKKATRLATVSDYSKNDIVNTYQISQDKVDVVYNGANLAYQPVDEEVKEEVKKKFSQGNDYFIFIGALHPRKNVVRLLEAFDYFKESSGKEVKLIIVGNEMFKSGEIYKTYQQMNYGHDVIFTGRLEIDDLSKVLGSALALTFVPLFEGFGIPVIESFYCDTPVIVSNVTSLPEIAGDAACYVDPQSVSEIADAMMKISHDKAYRETLIEKGRKQRNKFSWDQTSTLLWRSIEQIMK